MVQPVFTSPPTKPATEAAVRSYASHRHNESRYCTKCGHVGCIFTEDLTEFPEGGWYKKTPCECSAATVQQELLESSGIPVGFVNATLDGWHNTGRTETERRTNQETMDVARRVHDRLPEATEDGVNFWLYGSSGAGKTYIACSLLRAAITAHGYTGRFIAAASLVREAIEHREDFDALFHAGWLVVDGIEDLPETRFGYEMTLVIDLLRHRVHQKRPTIFTADRPISGLPERLKRTFEPLLLARTVQRKLEGEAYRTSNLVEKWT